MMFRLRIRTAFVVITQWCGPLAVTAVGHGERVPMHLGRFHEEKMTCFVSLRMFIVGI